jgi:hypothetical protein
LLLSHAFHLWIHTPIPSVWPNRTTTDFFLLLEAYRKSGDWSFIVEILLYRSRTNKEKQQQLKLACGVLHQFKQSSLGGYGSTLLSVWNGTLSWGLWFSWNEETVGQQNPRNFRVCQEDFQSAYCAVCFLENFSGGIRVSFRMERLQ